MTLKEFIHAPDPHLDGLASETETQRTLNEESAYEDYIEDVYHNWMFEEEVEI